ncbi:MAG: hypothetical protein NTW97_10875, partial [Candidatus Krumholzibacteria bacterium]|nr:hypothetical protein [Candidatus Krumholzibacteria bacterium]
MQGRVREGGDHLAALRKYCKGHTSFFRPQAPFRRNRLEGIALRVKDLFGAVEGCFRLFPILTPEEDQGDQAVLRYCMRA